MERTNIRYVTKEQIPEPIDLVVIDVSFISLKLVLPVVKELLTPGGEVLCLVKPQFEAGRDKVGKKGVVRDKPVHMEVLESFINYAESSGFSVRGMTFSPIKGPEGNIEYLGYLGYGDAADIDIKAIVEASHAELDAPKEGEG
jgi:23S rRNA (cytidine1920-2'-O)/16S rRNA (cytidine1409-2'-O)-methyltransferase